MRIGTHRGLVRYSAGMGAVYRPLAGRPDSSDRRGARTGPPFGVTRPGASLVLLAIPRQ
ncbi:MAG: hypothetical protein M3R71_02725 [Actinomycetota bacterium]|nr:hypothetical protein [Actinomycetota bacterium]